MDHARRVQLIDLDALQSELEIKLNEQQKVEYLSEMYPCLYIFLLELLGKTDQIGLCMAECKPYENNSDRYSLYI